MGERLTAPQTFGEWWHEYGALQASFSKDVPNFGQRVWEAAIASQQAEIEAVRRTWAETDTAHRNYEARLIEGHARSLAEAKAEIERLNSIAQEERDALLACGKVVRRYEAVVEAAREVEYEINRMIELGHVPQLSQIQFWRDRLRSALAALESS